MVDALVAHVAHEDAAVGGEPRDRDAEVVVDLEDLALVGRELRLAALERREHDVRVALFVLVRGLVGMLCVWLFWGSGVVVSVGDRCCAVQCVSAEREGGVIKAAAAASKRNETAAHLQADGAAALLDGLHRVLDLEEPALRRPRADVGVILLCWCVCGMWAQGRRGVKEQAGASRDGALLWLSLSLSAPAL